MTSPENRLELQDLSRWAGASPSWLRGVREKKHIQGIGSSLVVAALLIAPLGIVTEVHFTQPIVIQSPTPTHASNSAPASPSSTTAPTLKQNRP
jgi:hypothetical protein